jgi:thiazole tautomerase (transcriptional regulator TenI)
MLPRLHLVTDDRVLAQPDLIPRATALIERFGVTLALHVRGATTSASRLFEVADALVRLRPAAVLLNDRVDLALAAGAAGVQLRRDSLPIDVVRGLVGPRWIGYSAHAADEAQAAGRAGADFIIAGSLYASASHPGPGRGIAFLRELVNSVTIPVIAIGGIDLARVRDCRIVGAHGIAVIRAVWDAADPAEAAHQLLSALHQEVEDEWP